MNEAPERIWASPNPSTVYMDGSSPLTVRDRQFHRAVEYIRADLVPDPATIHAKAIAQAVELAENRYKEWNEETEVEDDFSACRDIATAIRALSPNPSPIVVRRKQLEAWINEIDRWGGYSEYKGMGRVDEDTMIAEMRALIEGKRP